MRFANVDLQAVFRFEVVLTLVTLENFLLFRLSLLFRGCFHGRRFFLRWSTMLLGQELCSPPGISSFDDPSPLVSKENVKEGPTLRVKLKVCPLLASAWQKAMHWEAKS